MITKEAKELTNYNNIYFTSSARVGFRHLLHSLEFNNDEKILLPSYIGITDKEGSGVIDPVETVGIDYEFYPIANDFSIDKDEFRIMAETRKFKAALIIHYFGFLQSDIEFIQKVCKDNSILLIEDCAHALYSSHKKTFLGDYGDFSFYSIHKFLPSKDGGILKINNSDYSLAPLKNSDKISSESLEIFSKARESEISRIRIDNYLYLLKLLKSVDDIGIVYPKLDEGIVPMNFPILIKNISREKLYFKLADKDFPTIALYYRLVESISKKLFPISHQLSKTILNLPVHQDTSKEDIDTLVDALVKSIQSLK